MQLSSAFVLVGTTLVSQTLSPNLLNYLLAQVKIYSISPICMNPLSIYFNSQVQTVVNTLIEIIGFMISDLNII